MEPWTTRKSIVGGLKPISGKQPALHISKYLSAGADKPASSLISEGRLGPGHGTSPPLRTSSFRNPQVTFRTDLSYILYLVNLLDLLGLPANWGREDGNATTLTPHLSGWAIVEALARALLGESRKSFGFARDDISYESDPIWSTLAGLDGREPGTPIGVGLPAQSDFRLPAGWLKRFGSAGHRWVALRDGSRLHLVDPAHGYLVADILLDGRRPEQAADCEIEAYLQHGVAASYVPAFSLYALPFPELPPNLAKSLSEPTAWWLVRVLGFMRHVLSTIPYPTPIPG